MAAIGWKSAVSGSWTLGSNWDSGTVPAGGDDVTIGIAGTYTVTLTASISVNSITLSDPKATLSIANSGGTETIAGTVSNAGTLNVDGSFGDGSSLVIGSTLSNSGVVNIGNTGLGASTTTTVTASGLANTGTINLTGDTTTTTLAQLKIPAPVTLGNFNILNDAFLRITSGAVGGIDAGTTFSLRNDAFAISLNASGVTTGTFSNAGTLSVDSGVFGVGGSSLSIGSTLSNSGLVNIGDPNLGAATTVTATGLINTGTINLTGSATKLATLNILGPAPATLGNFNINGDVLLQFVAGGAVTSNAAGTTLLIRNDPTALSLNASGNTTGTFSNVGTLSVDSGVFGVGGSSLSIGSTLSNSGLVNIGDPNLGAATTVTATGLINTGTINLTGSATKLATLNILGPAPATLGNFNINGDVLLQFVAGGAVTSNAAGTTLLIRNDPTALSLNASGNTTGTFSNAGTLSVDSGVFGVGGSSLSIGSTLSNSGLVNIGDPNLGAATTVTATGLINTGTINLTGSATKLATLNILGPAPATLGNFNINGDVLLQFVAGGAVTSNAAGTTLLIRNDPTALSLNASGNTTGTFSNAGTLSVDSGVFGVGGSSLSIGSTLSNSGLVNIGDPNLGAATTVTATGLINTKTINLSSKLNGARATLSIIGPGTAGIAAGVNLGTITSNADGIAVNGAARLVNGSSGSAAGLISAGYAGVLLSGDGVLVNYGTIKGNQVGVSLEPNGSVFGNGVSLTNYGLVSGGVGIVSAGGGPAGTADRVVNHGNITGTSGAGIILGDSFNRVDNFGTISGANGTAVVFGSGIGSSTVVIEPGAVFNGVLGGLAKYDVIDFAGVSATGFGFGNGKLTLFNNGKAVGSAAVTGNFTLADLALASDGNGGVEIGVGLLGPVITGTYYTPVQLSDPAINNSATVTETGRIASAYGDAVVGAVGVAGTITNLGTITTTGSSGAGVNLAGGGLVANGTVGFAGGYISGVAAGVSIAGGTGTVTNSGTIKGGSGVVIATGSSVTVSNSGTIAGTAGTSVSLGGGNNRLILAPGALFQGKADGGGGNSVVEVATSLVGLGAVGAVDTAVAAIYVSLGSVSNFSALQVDPGAATDADGNLTFETLVNQGQLNLLAGDSLAIGTVAAAATGGTIDLKSGGSVHFTGAVAAGQTVLFRPPGGSVLLDHPEQFAAAITQFAATDLIDLPLGTASFQQYAGGVLSLNYGGGTVALQLATIYATPQFQFTGDGHGGTDILVSDAVCFCRGTLILAERGEVAVEDLAVGERVRTLSGAAKPIVWIGTGSAPVGRGNRLARPVIVRRGALAEGVPSRDLYLTHGRALYLDGVLIPVENLVNHRSILWDESAESVEYYHIELADHDVLLANGAPAESYYDASNRAQFHNTRDGSRPGAAKMVYRGGCGSRFEDECAPPSVTMSGSRSVRPRTSGKERSDDAFRGS